ncbi:MAG TPA: hypothetical protein VKR30_02215 [Candidatus Limnocylindrales bacterium]|nr:hypothetical protein [Candidatus Limnocylindrales bacterium]
MAEPRDPGAPTAGGRVCPWCSGAASETDTSCPSCGAALAQREDLGGVLIPGVTGVDPGLKALADQPMRLKGPSPTQGLASGIVPAVALGGPAGLAILGGIAAVAATEYLGSRGPGGAGVDPASVGELGGVAQLALEQAKRAESTSTGQDHTWDVPAPRESGPEHP